MKKIISKKTALVTGAGTGVGRATAIQLSALGWKVAIIGRNEETLRETATLCRKTSGSPLLLVCDVGRMSSVEAAVGRALRQFGGISALINCAGTNVPKRGWSEISPANFRRILDTNLVGTFNSVHAVLPGMRSQGGGTIVNIVSDAGLRANKKAGVAYIASKFGQTGITQSINEEERENGIRACAIFPGDIDTPLLKRRPVFPSDEARQRMLQPEDVADCALLALTLPKRAVIEHLVVRPSAY